MQVVFINKVSAPLQPPALPQSVSALFSIFSLSSIGFEFKIELINKLGVLVTSPNLKSACILSLAKMHCRGSLAIQST